MNAEDMEIELRRTCAADAPKSIEARLLESARRLRAPRRPMLPRVLALAAAAGFFALVAALVRSEGRLGTPAGPQEGTRIEKWTYTLKKPDPATGREAVVAILQGDSSTLKMVGGKAVVDARALTIQVFAGVQGPECSFTFRSDSGHFDERSGRVGLDGNIRVERADGFSARASSATVDLETMTFTMSIDCMARFVAHLAKYRSKSIQPIDRPKVEISAPKAVGFDQTTTFVAPRVVWKFPVAEEGIPPFTVRFEGAEGRSDADAYSVTGKARASFEDGRNLQALDVALSKTTPLLRLTVSFK